MELKKERKIFKLGHNSGKRVFFLDGGSEGYACYTIREYGYRKTLSLRIRSSQEKMKSTD